MCGQIADGARHRTGARGRRGEGARSGPDPAAHGHAPSSRYRAAAPCALAGDDRGDGRCGCLREQQRAQQVQVQQLQDSVPPQPTHLARLDRGGERGHCKDLQVQRRHQEVRADTLT